MFPDTATMYLAAIEDQDYKDEKINCAATSQERTRKPDFLEFSLGERVRI